MAAAFGDHMWNINNSGFALVNGLIDTLKDGKPGKTSHEIADEKNMKERYVREWLGCMVAAKIVTLRGDKYYIPTEHFGTVKAVLAWGYGTVAWVRRFEKTKTLFAKDTESGDDPTNDDNFWVFFGGFRDVIGEGFVKDVIGPAMGKDFEKEQNPKVLDIGSGTGAFAIALAKLFPEAKILGIEPCEKARKVADTNKDKNSLDNLEFKDGDAHNLGMKEEYDRILMLDVLHDLHDPLKALAEIEKALKPDGKVVILEIGPHSKQADNAGVMVAAMCYSVSMFCCLQSSLQEGGEGFGTCWGEENITKAIGDFFKIEKKTFLDVHHVLYQCIKK